MTGTAPASATRVAALPWVVDASFIHIPSFRKRCKEKDDDDDDDGEQELLRNHHSRSAGDWIELLSFVGALTHLKRITVFFPKKASCPWESFLEILVLGDAQSFTGL